MNLYSQCIINFKLFSMYYAQSLGIKPTFGLHGDQIIVTFVQDTVTLSLHGHTMIHDVNKLQRAKVCQINTEHDLHQARIEGLEKNGVTQVKREKHCQKRGHKTCGKLTSMATEGIPTPPPPPPAPPPLLYALWRLGTWGPSVPTSTLVPYQR